MSKYSGGGAQEWLQELTPEGNIVTEGDLDIRGCHKGFYTGLNVVNPQPGFEYQWPLNNLRSIQLARQRGWRQVQGDDPEMAGFRTSIMGDHDDSDQVTPLDTSDVFQDVVLMRIPSEQLGEIREGQANDRKASLQGGGTSAYLHGARHDEIMSGHGRTTRFAHAHHGVELTEGGQVVGQWQPDPESRPKGIISEE